MANTRKLPPTDLLQRDDCACLVDCVHTFLQQHSLHAAKLCVGLSGGLDSVVLLHVLARCREHLPVTLSAVHVDHGISSHAREWSEFAQAFAAELAVPCQVFPLTLVRRGGESLEAVARQARYAIYQQQPTEVIALAHHQDDQAETVLLQLMRGSGVVGLAAMPKIRPLTEKIRIIRPLRDVPRAVLLAYAQAHQLSWVEDESNHNTDYQRNFVRHDILPRLEARYPQVANTLGRAADYFAEASDLLADLARIDCPELSSSAHLPQATLLTLSQARQRNVLYWYLRAHAVLPDEKIILQLQHALHTAAADKMPTFTVQGKQIYLAQGVLAIVPIFTPPVADIVLQWQGEAVLDIPAWCGSIYFSNPSPPSNVENKVIVLTVRARQGGERLRLNHNRPQQTVKNLWQANRVPAWQRQRLPFLWHNSALVWVPGAGLSCESPLAMQGVTMTWVSWSD